MSARRDAIVTALVVSLAALSVACGTGKREAASLVAAVDRARRASMDTKGAPADALEKVVCSDAEVCAAKDACLAWSRPTVRASTMKRDVASALDDLEAGRITKDQAAAMGLSQKLTEASHALDEGSAKLPACDAQVLSLRLKYGL